MENEVAGPLESILEFMPCAFFGKCKFNEYEYHFYLNDGKIKADDCFTSAFGRTECIVNETTYQNVAYETKILKTEIKKDYTLAIIIWSIIIPTFFFKLFNLFTELYGKPKKEND